MTDGNAPVARGYPVNVDDLPARLRQAAESLHLPPSIQCQKNIRAMNACDEAAKEIERLRGVAQAGKLPAIPDDDEDFTPDLARKIVAKYQELLSVQKDRLGIAQKLIAEYKAGTIAGARAEIASGAQGAVAPWLWACTGCGSQMTMDQIKGEHPSALCCCPERRMAPLPSTEQK